jgi:hypothetical protein
MDAFLMASTEKWKGVHNPPPMVIGIVHIAKLIKQKIETAERFYLPSKFEILAGKEYTEEVKNMAVLPFNEIAILCSQLMVETQSYLPKIIVAATAKAAGWFTNQERSRQLGFKSENDFIVYCALKYDAAWVPFPYGAICNLDSSISGVYIVGLGTQDNPLANQASNEMKNDVQQVIDLCVMLNLNNVSTKTETVPVALNLKRQRSGRPPLYSYKVLEVDGEIWRSRGAHGEAGREFRSHMRRGHIRRIDETRRVWVRATMVHGKRPGFVDKEYHALLTR